MIEQITENGITYEVETDDGGSKSWWLNGERHRVDGPAIEWSDGSKEWFLNGKCHRVDGPAVKWDYGSKFWYLNGKRHRVDGPAIERADGSKGWFLNGKKHRVDGPAAEYENGIKEWYLNGEQLSEEEFNEFRKQVDELKQNPEDAPLYIHHKHLGSIAKEILEAGGVLV